MVGMNSRSSEPRRSGGSQTAKKDRQLAVEQNQLPFPSSQPQRPKPSAEQVHIAQMFEDKTPDDLDEKIQQVLAVVVGKNEEDVSVALHDHDYCVEKAIEALLDSAMETQWEVKKSKKKGQVDYSQEPASSSSEPRTKGPSRGTGNKAALRAASHTRENYGGNVTVTTNHIDGRDRGKPRTKGPASGGGRSGGRPGGSRPDNSSSGGRRERSDKDRSSRPRRRDKGPSNSKVNGRVNHHKVERENLDENVEPKKDGILDYSIHNSVPHTGEVWGGTIGGGGQWNEHDEEQPLPLVDHEHPVDRSWLKDTADLSSVFPDAIPANQMTSEHKMVSEERPSSSASPHSPSTTVAPASVRTAVVKPLSKTKQRRYMPSQIPSQPVEMPVGVDTLNLELSSLGIGFGGSTEEERVVVDSTPASTIISTHQYEEVVVSSPQPATVHQSLSLPMVASYAQSLPDDPTAVIVSANLAASYKEPSSKLEPPPGLTHPSHHADKSSSSQLLPTPTESLSRHTHNPPPQPAASELGNLLITSTVTHPHPTSTATLALSGMDLLGSRSEATTSIPLPTVANSVNVTVSCTTASATATSAEGLFSSQAATSVPPPQPAPATTAGTGSITSSAIAPTVAATVSGGGGIKSSSSHSSGSKSHSSSVPHAAGMVYPHQMLPHFAAPYGNAPMMMPTYPYDMDTLNRYPNATGYYGQHATSQEQSALASAVNRDHTSSAFAGPGENKFDVTSPLTSSNPSQQQQQQQQQQQGSLQQPNQLGPPFYPYNFVYSNMMYNPHLSMAAAQFTQPMGHKPGGSSSYPVVSTYQTTAPAAEFNLYGATGDLGSASALEYKAGYPLSKSTNVPTATSSTGSDFYKQYENKSTAGYGNFVPAQYGFFPPMMPPMMHTHDSTSSRGKHNKGYHGGAGMGGWTAQQHNA